MVWLRAAAIVSFAWFFYGGFVAGWNRSTTDFPNYYTAARVVGTNAPLADYFDYPRFQRQVDRVGGTELGAYIPQTPLTMLPVMPFAWLDIRTAKRGWLILNLGLLLGALWLLSRITQFNLSQLWLVAFAGYFSLRENFLLGQYYVLLLALPTLAIFCEIRGRSRIAGTALAAAFALKLYGAPFAVFLAARKRWAALTAMVVATVLLAAVAVGMFRWDGIAFFVTQVLPRALAGETLNPFHPSNGSFITLLRRTFVAEPSLNPHPLVTLPPAFAFFQTGFTLTVLLLPALATWGDSNRISKRDFAWWIVAAIAASPNTASYTFVLLIAPIVLFLDELPKRRWFWLLLLYFALTIPLRPAFSFLFPRAWLLLGLYLWTGRERLLSMRRGVLAAAGIGVITASLAVALVSVNPPRPSGTAVPIAIRPDAIYSSSPVSTARGIYYESIVNDRYATQRWDHGKFQTFGIGGGIGGNWFHPAASDSGNVVYGELSKGPSSSIASIEANTGALRVLALGVPDPYEPAASHGGGAVAFVSGGKLYLFEGNVCRRLDTPVPVHEPSFAPGDRQIIFTDGSRILRFDRATGRSESILGGHAGISRPSISPDGRHLLFASRQTGSWHVWSKVLPGGTESMVTGGRCNSFGPGWQADSRHIVFASDCGRGLGLPGLWIDQAF